MHRRILLRALLGILLMLSTAWAEYATEEPAKTRVCNHGGIDLWNVLRMIPVQFTEFKGDAVEWQYKDEYTVRIGAFGLRENTQFISRERKEVNLQYVSEHKDSGWICYYCSECNALLRANELKSGSSRFN